MNKTDLWGVFLRDVCKKERDHEIEREREKDWVYKYTQRGTCLCSLIPRLSGHVNDTFHTASNRSWAGPGNEASVCVHVQYTDLLWRRVSLGRGRGGGGGMIGKRL